MRVRDSACGLPDQGGGSHFCKRGPEGVLQLLGHHIAQPFGENAYQGNGKEALTSCRFLSGCGTEDQLFTLARIPKGSWDVAHLV